MRIAWRRLYPVRRSKQDAHPGIQTKPADAQFPRAGFLLRCGIQRTGKLRTEDNDFSAKRSNNRF
jgi:hypothetical protein